MQIVLPIIDTPLHVLNAADITLGYKVDDTPFRSPLKSLTTLAAVPEQE